MSNRSPGRGVRTVTPLTKRRKDSRKRSTLITSVAIGAAGLALGACALAGAVEAETAGAVAGIASATVTTVVLLNRGSRGSEHENTVPADASADPDPSAERPMLGAPREDEAPTSVDRPPLTK
jgi:hypothetical protein